MLNRKQFIAVFGTISALVLAGCSSTGEPSGTSGGPDGSSSMSASDQTPTSSSQNADGAETAGPIVIGMITSLSGAYSSLGQDDQNTVELLAKQLNDAGGVDGRQIKIEYVDDQSSPTQASVGLDKIVQSKPSAIIGPVLSSNCMAIIDKVETLKIPMVTTCSTNSQITPVREYTFMSAISTSAQGGALAGYLSSTGHQKVGLLYDATDFGQAGKEFLEEDGTIDIVASASYKLDATTFAPQLQSLLAKSPDAVLAWGAGPPLVTIAKQYAQLGTDVPLVLSASGSSDSFFIEPAGAAANGVVAAASLLSVYQEAPDSPSKTMLTALAKDYEAAYGEPFSQFGADACGAWHVIINALENSSTTDPEDIRDAIESNPAVGCEGNYRYSATDHAGLQADDVWVVKIEDGKATATTYSLESRK